MKKIYIIVGLIAILAIVYLVTKSSNQNAEPASINTNTTMNITPQVQPIEHATAVIKFGGKVIYTDPVGGAGAFAGQPAPDLILVTDIHSDHLNADTLAAVKANAVIVAPQAVIDALPEAMRAGVVALANDKTTEQAGFSITGVPMYNVPESDKAFHTKGRGNGYVIEYNGTRLYVSGDTGNTPELRALQNIDVALLSMNLPYTMSVEDAAVATLAFKPKEIMPYHYRGPDGLSDVEKFKSLVQAGDPNIKVSLLNWYPNN